MEPYFINMIKWNTHQRSENKWLRKKNQSFLSRERAKLVVQNGVSFEEGKGEECGGFLMQLDLMLNKINALQVNIPFPLFLIAPSNT